MRKRLCMMLAVALLLCLIPAPACALSGIDLSRVKFSSGEEKLYFKFGDLSIEGVVRQEFPFTEEEINKLVFETLKEKKLTQMMVMDLNKLVERAQRASTFTKEDLERVKQNLITTIGTVPQASDAASLLDMINQYMSSNSWNDIGTVSVDLLTNSMNDKVKDTAKGYIKNQFGDMGAEFVKKAEWKDKLLNIAKFCDMLADEQAHDRQKWKDIANGANAKRKLDEFYDRLQEKIDDYKNKSDETGWTIDFRDAMTYRYFNFFGVDGNIQTWYLTMTMDQESTNEYGSVAGSYSGIYSMTAEHDMSAFTSGIAQAAPNIKPIKDFLQILKGSPLKPTFRKASDGSAYISRTIKGNCTAVIDESGEIQLTLSQENDETNVEFRDINVDLVLKTGTNADRYAENSLQINIGNKEEKVFVTFKSSSFKNLAGGSVSDQTYSAGGTGSGGWDENIWKPWDGAEKTLSFKQ